MTRPWTGRRPGRPTGSTSTSRAIGVARWDLPHLSKDGTALIFRSKLESVNPAAIAFDPANARIGAVTPLQNRTGILTPFDISPDGKWLALVNVPDRQQDLFLMHPDGSGLKRLTDDDARDWSPAFTPDGTALTYFSNPSGKYDGWSIRLDGSGRTRLTDFKPGVTFSMFAPDGKRLVAGLIPAGGVLGQGPWPITEKSADTLRLTVEGGTMAPTHWSPDGRWLSGYVVTSSGEVDGFGLYDVAAGRARQLNRDSRSYSLAWLPGQRRVVYFISRETLVVQDIESLERREVTGVMPYPPDLLGNIVASADGRSSVNPRLRPKVRRAKRRSRSAAPLLPGRPAARRPRRSGRARASRGGTGARLRRPHGARPGGDGRIASRIRRAGGWRRAPGPLRRPSGSSSRSRPGAAPGPRG